MKFSKTYFILTILLLVVEILIAVYVKGGFIRHFVGDIFAVVLVYTSIRSIINRNYLTAALWSLYIAFGIELLQATPFLEWSGLSNHKLVTIVLGNTFAWSDLLAYVIGFILIILIEKHVSISLPATSHAFQEAQEDVPH